jgi:hypothetical protein
MPKNGWIVFVSGAAAGVALVVACNQTKSASASPSDCAVWQYASATDISNLAATPPVLLGTIPAGELPAKMVYANELTGWQPFAVQADDTVLARRCKP